MAADTHPLLDRLWHSQPPSRKVVTGAFLVLVIFGLLHPLVADGEGAEPTPTMTLQTELQVPDQARTRLVNCFDQQRPDQGPTTLPPGEVLGAKIEIRKGKTRLVTFTTVPQGLEWTTPCLERELVSVAWPGARKADGTVTFAADSATASD